MSVPGPQGFALSAEHINFFFFSNSCSDVTISTRRMSSIVFSASG